MTAPDRPRVLLLWPGGLFAGGKNFGVPQLLSIAAAIHNHTQAHVDVVDLDFERAFGPVDLANLARTHYDVVGISCYSSFDYLKVIALAQRFRQLLPNAWMVTGGYHPSSRPDDFLNDQSPFDFVVLGDGEQPMSRLVEDCARGKRPSAQVLGPEPFDPAASPIRLDWTLLDRYRPIARKVASQAEIYLSRGCPFSCSFCMERAKRCTAWRALDPIDAVEELHRLDAYLDLSGWTLFLADALFGMLPVWRRSFLDALARRPIRARKVWMLTRLDLLEREDLALMAVSNVAPGFGLESGDPALLSRMHKTEHGEKYLEKMALVAAWATARGVPFGVNLILGHPGETEASMRTTASYVRKVFLGNTPTTGFVSVDPFRLYPGSDIDRRLDAWQSSTGMRAHRYPWWHDGDQDFLAEWVDPSSTLDYRSALRLRLELFSPIVRDLRRRFPYRGPAQDYFERALEEQVQLVAPRRVLRTLGLWHLWNSLVTGRTDEQSRVAIAHDTELADAARDARIATLDKNVADSTELLRQALEHVPRERFVRLEDLAAASEDRALALLEGGHATISAMHSYVRTFGALELGPGDDLVDLGGGTGYGAAIAAHVVGPQGRVRTLEIDAALSELARGNLAHLPTVEVIHADAHQTDQWQGASKVSVGFAVEEIPQIWVDALGEGGMLVAPVGPMGDQRLTRVTRTARGTRVERLGEVRYVPDRSARFAPREGEPA